MKVWRQETEAMMKAEMNWRQRAEESWNLYPINKGIYSFQPRHSKDQRLSPDRGNEESISHGDTSDRVRQNDIRIA
jgi:hypothetical protein